ncbi:hypothetical protein [Parafrankia sp. EUN1f]|nr:hypothetical protein [Parafrankia sp. EUN1f]
MSTQVAAIEIIGRRLPDAHIVGRTATVPGSSPSTIWPRPSPTSA